MYFSLSVISESKNKNFFEFKSFYGLYGVAAVFCNLILFEQVIQIGKRIKSHKSANLFKIKQLCRPYPPCSHFSPRLLHRGARRAKIALVN